MRFMTGHLHDDGSGFSKSGTGMTVLGGWTESIRGAWVSAMTAKLELVIKLSTKKLFLLRFKRYILYICTHKVLTPPRVVYSKMQKSSFNKM